MTVYRPQSNGDHAQMICPNTKAMCYTVDRCNSNEVSVTVHSCSSHTASAALSLPTVCQRHDGHFITVPQEQLRQQPPLFPKHSSFKESPPPPQGAMTAAEAEAGRQAKHCAGATGRRGLCGAFSSSLHLHCPGLLTSRLPGPPPEAGSTLRNRRLFIVGLVDAQKHNRINRKLVGKPPDTSVQVKVWVSKN